MTANEVSIRPARSEDRELMRRVGMDVIRALARGFYPREALEAWANWSKDGGPHAAGSQRQSFVAVFDSKVVGFSTWMPHRNEPKTAHIKAVFVHPNWARRGIGMQMLDVVEQDALSSGYEQFTVGSSLNGVPFYDAAGYVTQQTQSMNVAPGVDMKFELMRKN